MDDILNLMYLQLSIGNKAIMPIRGLRSTKRGGYRIFKNHIRWRIENFHQVFHQAVKKCQMDVVQIPSPSVSFELIKRGGCNVNNIPVLEGKAKYLGGLRLAITWHHQKDQAYILLLNSFVRRITFPCWKMIHRSWHKLPIGASK